MHGSSWLLWLGAALALAVVEAVTVDFVFIMLALGALAGALASFFGAGLAPSVFVAIAVALLGLWLVRPVLQRSVSKRQRDNSDIGVHAIVGSHGQVVKETSERGGLVRVAGDTWSAVTTRGLVLEVGQTVRVNAVRGATISVEPVQLDPYPHGAR